MPTLEKPMQLWENSNLTIATQKAAVVAFLEDPANKNYKIFAINDYQSNSGYYITRIYYQNYNE